MGFNNPNKNVHHALIKQIFFITLSYQFKDKNNLQTLIYIYVVDAYVNRCISNYTIKQQMRFEQNESDRNINLFSDLKNTTDCEIRSSLTTNKQRQIIMMNNYFLKLMMMMINKDLSLLKSCLLYALF